MTQYRTFFVPLHDEGEAQDRLNAFLRAHRVLQVARNALPDGWAFCVEWLDVEARAEQRFGRGGSSNGGDGVDYLKQLEPEQFARYARMRDARRDLAQGGIRASRSALRRYRTRVRALEGRCRRGLLGEDELAASVTSMTAFLRLADTAAWRRSRLATETEERPRGRLVCNGAGAGTTVPTTAALPDATTTLRPIATTTSASGSLCLSGPQHCSSDRRPVDSPSPFSVSVG